TPSAPTTSAGATDGRQTAATSAGTTASTAARRGRRSDGGTRGDGRSLRLPPRRRRPRQAGLRRRGRNHGAARRGRRPADRPGDLRRARPVPHQPGGAVRTVAVAALVLTAGIAAGAAADRALTRLIARLIGDQP